MPRRASSGMLGLQARDQVLADRPVRRCLRRHGRLRQGSRLRPPAALVGAAEAGLEQPAGRRIAVEALERLDELERPAALGGGKAVPALVGDME